MGTNIPVSEELADHISDRKDRGETYDDWLREHIEFEDELEAKP